jgi:hypothetical protein
MNVLHSNHKSYSAHSEQFMLLEASVSLHVDIVLARARFVLLQNFFAQLILTFLIVLKPNIFSFERTSQLF